MNTQKIAGIINAMLSILFWIDERDKVRSALIEVLKKASDEGRDVTSDEVRTELDRVGVAIDETLRIIEESETT